MNPKKRQCSVLTWTLISCALGVAGCAAWRLPRIDPTGERIFIRPQNQGPPYSLAAGNPVASPVFTNPVFPPPVPPGPTSLAAPISGLLPPLPQDRLSITPDRVLAPVGSEVVLKAGVCTPENFLLTDTKTEWLIARESAGEFVSLGGRGWLRSPLLPWNKPKKIDNQYATGYAASVPLTITRGTADTSDDVQVEPGEAWATITSPVEGTSHVTAVAPEIVAWSGRRATATIYWIDVQWTFPPAAVSAGGAQALTTTVRRQSDGTPIEGWLVHYEVDGGAGALTGSQSGQVVDVATDINGQASIDVSPTGGSGTASRINMQIVRPVRYAGSDMPRLVIASGTSTINWTDTAGAYLPPPDNIETTPIPSLPSTPLAPQAAKRPVLKIEIHNEPQVLTGGDARFEVVIRNQGDAAATGIVVKDRFDKGLSHLEDSYGYQQLEKEIGDIAPGNSQTVILNFKVLQAGHLCHTVTVTSREGASTHEGACVNATEPPPQTLPGSENAFPREDVLPQEVGAGLRQNNGIPVRPLQQEGLQLDLRSLANNPVRAGTFPKYEITVANKSATPDADVQLRVHFPPGIVPDPTTLTPPEVQASFNGNELRIDTIPEIQAAARLRFTVQAKVAEPSVGTITARLTSRKLVQPIEQSLRVEVVR